MCMCVVLWSVLTVSKVFDGTCEGSKECACLVSYVCKYAGGLSRGERQLPFTAPGGNKGGRGGSYLGSFIGAGGRERLVLLGSQ